MLRGEFSRDTAAACREFVWRSILSWENCITAGQPMVHVQRSFSGPPFGQVIGQRIRDAIHQLTGPARAIVHESFGWWPGLFPGFPGPGGWHVDGSNLHHHLTSREQGLVTLFLFSDIGSGDGGTPVVCGSHRAVARLLAASEAAGLSHVELHLKLPPVNPAEVIEVTGEAGDVAMLHPMAIHGFGPNRGSRIRFACNPQYQLEVPMQLDRVDANYSPVEDSIRAALAQ